MSFARHLVGACTPDQRRELAVPAQEVFQAIREGRHVDLVGVEIGGVIHFDRLPLQDVTSDTVPLPSLRAALRARGIRQVRVVRGTLSIQDSTVPDVLATNLLEGAIIFHGPVTMKGTTFRRSIDFSKSVFLKPLDFSDAVILYETFFIEAQFFGPVAFEAVSFGTHTRFYRSVFHESVTFARSRFQGLAEFLEIHTQATADFSSVIFSQGTGFSGARFGRDVKFSNSRFEHETFFRFTEFRARADFQQATFEQTVDFTGAIFRVNPDFSHATFARPPNPSLPIPALRSNMLWQWVFEQRQQLIVFVILATATIITIWTLRRA